MQMEEKDRKTREAARKDVLKTIVRSSYNFTLRLILLFISNLKPFIKMQKVSNFPSNILNKITATAIEHAREIFVQRDSDV